MSICHPDEKSPLDRETSQSEVKGIHCENTKVRAPCMTEF